MINMLLPVSSLSSLDSLDELCDLLVFYLSLFSDGYEHIRKIEFFWNFPPTERKSEFILKFWAGGVWAAEF